MHGSSKTKRAVDDDSDEPSKRARIPWNPREASYVEAPWSIVRAYFTPHKMGAFVRHQLESYNDFVQRQLSKTIEMFNPVNIASRESFHALSQKYQLELSVRFENLRVQRPQVNENNGSSKLMMPHDARTRNISYSAATMVDLHVTYTVRRGQMMENVETTHEKITSVHLGKLPVMVKSHACILSQYTHSTPAAMGECAYDLGGYFIVTGSEKTVQCQERKAENRVYVYDATKSTTKKGNLWRAEIRSVPDYKSISAKVVNVFMAAKHNGWGHPLTVEMPRLKQAVPLFVLFRALGVLSDRAICETIVLDLGAVANAELVAALQASASDASACRSQQDALAYLTSLARYTPVGVDRETGARRKREFTLDVLEKDLFPHCRTVRQKQVFLGHMVHKLLLVHFRRRAVDDQDSYDNKRVDAVGTLLNNLYRSYLNKVVKDMEKQVVKEIEEGMWRSIPDDPYSYMKIINASNISKIVKASTLETGLKKALANGDFTVKCGGGAAVPTAAHNAKVGVAQVLNRLNHGATVSHLRRVNTPADKGGKLVPPRKLHGTSYGYICPAETPEGPTVGLVKNLATMAHVTVHSDPEPLYDYVLPHVVPVDELPLPLPATAVKVLVNGAWVGVTHDPVQLYASLKHKKLRGILNVYTSVVLDCKWRELRVCNDAGRLARPLLRVKPRQFEHDNPMYWTPDTLRRLDAREMTWDSLLLTTDEREAVIEYLDAEEQMYALIATDPAHLREPLPFTHCEIHPSLMLGVTAGCIPFPDHNQSPRNCYQCAQGKQAMGIPVTNPRGRFDKTLYVMTYPQQPLVDTRLMRLTQLDRMSSGQNMFVAIMAHTGFNQEDSVLMNRAAVDRGLAMVTVYHTERDEDRQKPNGDEEVRCKPDLAKTKGLKKGDYSLLNAKGCLPDNTRLQNRTVYFGKVSQIKEPRGVQNSGSVYGSGHVSAMLKDATKRFQDHSRVYKNHEPCFVDATYSDKNGDGYTFVKMRTRVLRPPQIGDKFSSRSGQKGTAGLLIAPEDMPYTSEGLCPDIIINPHAMPSRMTLGHLLETQFGKWLLAAGVFGDATAYNPHSVADVGALLQSAGFESHGEDVMYDPHTGEPMACTVFFGLAFYQRLKHMVLDKMHARATGSMVTATRQPTEGRARDGGLKFGEMERDGMIAHGAARFTKGRMYDASDQFVVHVCKLCGRIAAYNDAVHIYECLSCDNRAQFARVETPYAHKLLTQELNVMNIVPRFIVE